MALLSKYENVQISLRFAPPLNSHMSRMNTIIILISLFSLFSDNN